MAAESISVAIDLEGNAPEFAGNSADALEKLKESISASSAELAGMNKALRALKGSTGVSDDTIKKLKDRIAATKATIAQQTAAFIKAGGSFKQQSKPIEESRGAIAKWIASASGLPGPIGSIVGKLGGLGKVLAVGATLAFAAALVALAAAAAAAAGALALFALRTADARRSEELRLQGLSKFRNFWAEMIPGFRRAADSSTFLQRQLDEVAASSALGRDRIAEMQAELYRAGLRSGNLQAALEGLAIAESTQGAEGAAQFKARAIGAALYGSSVKRVSDDIKARLGGIAKAQMLSLDVQTRKLRENIAALFKDLKIEKLLTALNMITTMFSQSSASGRALKALIEGFFGPLGESAASAMIYVKRFFQGVTIGLLTMGIMVLRVRNYLRDTFGEPEWLKGLDKQKLAVDLGTIAVAALAGVVLAGAVAFIVLGAAIALALSPLIVFGIAVYTAVTLIKDNLDKLKEWMSPGRWFEAGANVGRGIADGIRSGIGEVISAMRDMALKPMLEFRHRMGIHSPSRLAFATAINVPHGVKLAYNVGTPEVRGAARSMAAATDAGMRAGFRNAGEFEAPMPARREPLQRGGAMHGGDRSVRVDVAPGAIVIQGAGDPSADANEILMRLEERIVNAARELGAAG